MIVAGSLFGGLLAAIVLVAGPFSGAAEHTVTGAILLGFAFGWALLAVLSVRVGDGSQRWAAVPAAVMATAGAALLVLAPGTDAIATLGWLWPPLLLALVVWMTLQARRQPAGWARPWLLYPVFGVLALAAVGGAIEVVGETTDRAAATVAGDRLVDVGGHRLHIRCTGSGTPTVVLAPGLGEQAAAMTRWIAPAVARTTRVCIYDRAGHGRSDVAPREGTGSATELHALLRRGGVPGPYVVAGHSLGGMVALSFADRYPGDVAGIALLDSMHPQQSNAFAGMDPLLSLLPSLARTGLGRLFFDPQDGNPVAQAQQFARDITEMPAELNRAAKLKTLGSRPLAVVTAGRDRQAGWLAHQDELAKLSSDSVHRIVAGSTHTSLIDDAHDAARSSRAITDVVLAARSGRPIAGR
jgi:pimeloyl-ACP methyl ester carboxylesterase